MMFYIYVLYSEKSDRYYVGHTNDVNRRLVEHNEISENSYTSKMRPWVLKCYFLSLIKNLILQVYNNEDIICPDSDLSVC